MPFWLYNIVMPLFGWLHIVGTTLLLGGILFYEFVMIEAVEDLKPWHQLGVLGHVRWTFRLIVVWSTLFLVASGIVMTWRLWPAYREDYAPTRIWWLTHVALGIVGMGIALRLTLYGRVPPHTRTWMRFNLILLLTVVFLAESLGTCGWSWTSRHRQTLPRITPALSAICLTMPERTATRPFAAPAARRCGACGWSAHAGEHHALRVCAKQRPGRPERQ